ncbi:metalloregulator ArsR/SmtB family transcription factor [Streptomyces sp. NBC_00841]|uniref:metalloregulator ArsR/SmtB family transcription factor n=1 Tax=unclassified Streptomyces TaxID=2593676 RepID=UPI0022597DB3|nr:MULTISPECIES: metalloregulator ArsR/SmtB family transcription factor [unclassified Streptomyces]MCX4535098.1 metalloregulator ArsR/SmtB family transcription factor [Streptomyces sp. NBC_01669]WRZ99587.1 metalloregulator ArsR/SmtB family transcription factor [Streptomyces sp. NBC_00841]
MGKTDEEASAFRALADPTRRQILEDLRGGELAAGEIAGRFAISAPSISRHLGVLKGAGLVTERRDGNRIFYSLAEDRLATSIGRFLSAVCPEQIVLRHTTWRSATETEGGTS